MEQSNLIVCIAASGALYSQVCIIIIILLESSNFNKLLIIGRGKPAISHGGSKAVSRASGRAVTKKGIARESNDTSSKIFNYYNKNIIEK